MRVNSCEGSVASVADGGAIRTSSAKTAVGTQRTAKNANSEKIFELNFMADALNKQGGLISGVVFYYQKRRNAKENKIYHPEQFEGQIGRTERLGRHKKDAEPHADGPAQAHVLGALALEKLQDERDVKKRQ